MTAKKVHRCISDRLICEDECAWGAGAVHVRAHLGEGILCNGGYDLHVHMVGLIVVGPIQ